MKKYRKKIVREIFINSLIIILSMFIALFIISNIGGILGVKEDSMEPNLQDGDRIIVNRFIYRFSKPKRGDIIILNKRNNYNNIVKNMKYELEEISDSINYNLNRRAKKDNLIKRIIGIPGDEIKIYNGKVYVNGREEEKYHFIGSTEDYKNEGKTINLPENKYYVLGDNRQKSLDSRDIGYIDTYEIKGRVKYRIWPLKKIGNI